MVVCPATLNFIIICIVTKNGDQRLLFPMRDHWTDLQHVYRIHEGDVPSDWGLADSHK
jgi:hypothetical protein